MELLCFRGRDHSPRLGHLQRLPPRQILDEYWLEAEQGRKGS